MADPIHVEVPRTVGRDELLEALRQRGHDARAPEGDEVGIEIPCDSDAGRQCDDVVADLEAFIAEAGLPLVPLRTDGAVSVRPPAS